MAQITYSQTVLILQQDDDMVFVCIEPVCKLTNIKRIYWNSTIRYYLYSHIFIISQSGYGLIVNFCNVKKVLSISQVCNFLLIGIHLMYYKIIKVDKYMMD